MCTVCKSAALPAGDRGAIAKDIALHKALGMQRLRWEQRLLGGRMEQRVNVIDIDSMLRPVFLQHNPTADGHFYYTHYVR